VALAIVDAFTEFKERGPDPVADTEGSQGPGGHAPTPLKAYVQLRHRESL